MDSACLVTDWQVDYVWGEVREVFLTLVGTLMSFANSSKEAIVMGFFSGPFVYATKSGFKVGARVKAGPVGIRISPKHATTYVSLSSLFKSGKKR